jgi:hypothetical protein
MSPEQRARQQQILNEQRKATEAQQKAEKERKLRIIQNWNKLQYNMTLDEVNELIGPIQNIEAFKGLESFLSAGSSTVPTSCNLRINDDAYFLRFGIYSDGRCRLSEYYQKSGK